MRHECIVQEVGFTSGKDVTENIKLPKELLKEKVPRSQRTTAGTILKGISTAGHEVLHESEGLQKQINIKEDGQGSYQSKTNVETDEIQEGETIVHYFYRGVSKLENILRPHHCNPSPLCMVMLEVLSLQKKHYFLGFRE